MRRESATGTGRLRRGRGWPLFLLIPLLAGVAASTAGVAVPPAGVAAPAAGGDSENGQRAAVQRILDDYTGLYTRATLDRWKTLFHPALSVAWPEADGTIRVRDLDGFFERQRNYFATGRRISERLENVRIDPGRRMARVSADFVFIDEGEERRGRLGLHLLQEGDTWKIAAILFSYDAEGR